MEKITRLIREALLSQFPDVGVDRVFVVSEVDADGDKILRVFVGLDGKNLRDREKLVSAPRIVRKRLADAKISESPVLSFLSKQDMNKIKRAAA
jgi:hypothetical protein